MENAQNETGALEAAQPETPDTSLFSVRSVLNLTWRTLRKSPVVFFGLTGLVYALQMIAEHGLRTLAPEISQRYYMLLQNFIALFLAELFLGAITYGVFQALKGICASLGASLFYGMKNFVHVILVGLISSSCITPCLSANIIISNRLVFYTGSVFLLFALLILGYTLMCMWLVAVPACAVERLGAIKSLSRSCELTKGCRMKIYGLFLIWGLALRFFYIPMLTAIEPGTAIFVRLVGLVIWAFGYVMAAVIYFELRKIKEGVGVENMADAFDLGLPRR
jgi:hypothetical protein